MHVQAAIFLEGGFVVQIMLFKHFHDFGRALIDPAFQMIEEIADGQIRFTDEGKIEAGIGPHRLQRDRCNMRAKGNRLGPARVCQKASIDVVFLSWRSKLRQVIFRLIFIQQFSEFGPAHAFRVAVHHLDLVDGVQ